MTCTKCKRPIEDMTVYRNVPGIGACHVECPSAPQQNLIGDEDRLPVDDDPQYPD